jgi:Prokaryotic Cytochrome C oxidase subunit IV
VAPMKKQHPPTANGSIHNKTLTLVWLTLIILTLISAFFAESDQTTAFTITLVCFTFGIKGALVIEHLMGLRTAAPMIRWLTLSYFIILSPIIALSVLFPETVIQLTTL